MTDIKIKRSLKLDREISLILKRFKIQHKSGSAVGNITYSEFLTDPILMITLIKEGIPYSLFSLIKDTTPLSETDWAIYLDISTKSLQRYKESSRRFKPMQSEKIIEMAEVTSIGVDVFGKEEKFRLWLETPNFALGRQKPKELLMDSYGKELVIGELIRINHGILV